MNPDPSQSGFRNFVPTVLRGIDGEPPTYVSAAVAETADAAVAYAQASGDLDDGEHAAERVLMRELDPIACKIRGVDEGWWVECTPRSKMARPFWRIDEARLPQRGRSESGD